MPDMILTARTLEEIGTALYGARWRSIMAERLGRTKRTIERYCETSRRRPPKLNAELADLIEKQIEVLRQFRDRIE